MKALLEPTRRDEAWRYIETSFLSEHPKGELQPSSSFSDLPSLWEGISGRLVIHGGEVAEDLSSPKILESLSINETSSPELFMLARKEDWYASRHTGAKTIVIDLPTGIQETPFEIFLGHLGSGAENRNSFLIKVPRASEHMILIRTHGCDEDYLANLEWGLELADGARVKVLFDQGDGKKALFLSSMRSTLGRDAFLEVQCLAGESRLTRQRLSVDLLGENSEVFLSGVGLCDHEESLHHFVQINHKVANARSRQLFKVAMQGEARSSFDGTIEVDKGADGTDANQLCRYLMLNDKVRASAKPQLKIYADDVACAHGATVGQLEDEERFYLISRGLSPEISSALLSRGFVTEVLEEGSFLQYTHDWQERLLSNRLPL